MKCRAGGGDVDGVRVGFEDEDDLKIVKIDSG